MCLGFWRSFCTTAVSGVDRGLGIASTVGVSVSGLLGDCMDCMEDVDCGLWGMVAGIVVQDNGIVWILLSLVRVVEEVIVGQWDWREGEGNIGFMLIVGCRRIDQLPFDLLTDSIRSRSDKASRVHRLGRSLAIAGIVGMIGHM